MKPLNNIIMRRMAVAIVVVISALCVTPLRAQSISSLWKDCKEAMSDDMPATAIELLHKIQIKAEQQKKYGDLLTALSMEVAAQMEISPDSVVACKKRIRAKWLGWKDKNGVLATMYQVAMYSYLSTNDDKVSSKPDIDSLLASPDAKTYTKANLAKNYKPFLEIQDDSRYFKHDLLSVIAMETRQYEALHRYCVKTGNRPAACVTAAQMAKERYSNIATIDSLISVYQDLPECGELAIVRANRYRYDQKGEQLAWIDEALRRWSSWRRIGELRNQRNGIIRPQYSASIRKQVINSDLEQKIYFNDVRNMNGVKVTLRKMQREGHDNYTVITDAGADTRTFSHDFKAHNEYEIWSDSLSLGRLPKGVWNVTIADKDGKMSDVTRRMHITDMKVIEQTLPNNKRRYVVVNNITGHPVAGATLHLLSRSYSKGKDEQEYTTDENGECITSNRDGVYAYATKGDDYGMPDEYIYSSYDCGAASPSHDYTNIYTDRAIYRPGQTVHAAVLCHRVVDGKETSAVTGKKVILTLRNANYKEIDSKAVTTDEYGMASADFTLPEDERNGQFSIRVNNATTSFRVEEYKRPTYDVTLEKPETAYKAGDTITVKGVAKTYSGVPVANAKVVYDVKRNIPWWWRYWYAYGGGGVSDDYNITLLKDTVYTEADGTFTVRMPMELPKWAQKPGYRCCFYSIVADAQVTDNAGESHSATLSLPISNRDVFFALDMKHEILADTTVTIRFTRLNNIGKEVEGDVSITLDGNALPSAKANKDYALPADIPSGKHLLTAICGNDTVQHSFVVFRKNDTKPMTYTHDWWYQSDTKFSETDGTAWIQVATSDNDVYAVYSLFSGDNVLESGSLRMDNNVMTRTFKYKEEYGDGVTYTIAWVKNDQLYEHSGSIRCILPSKKLKMQWTTFRNKLLPGQKEQWILNLKNPDGTPAKAQLMAVLYDKSLDAIVKHGWGTFDHRSLYLPLASWSTSRSGYIGFSSNAYYKSVESKNLEFTEFALKGGGDGYNSYGSSRRLAIGSMSANGRDMKMRAAPMMLESKAMVMKEVDDADEAVAEEAVETVEAGNDAEEANDNDGLRTNFEETAFFMPQLLTDAKGNVTMKFTLPESVTTWRFMGLAHDKAMRMGLLTDEAVVQKQLMVQPRMPRFLRQDDKAQINATVANLSKQVANTTVTMTLLDAETEKVLKTETQKLSVKAGETGTVTFPVDAGKLSDGAVICRIMAEANGSKDGEQHLLPILPNTELVTNTRTWTIFHPGDSVIAIDELLPAAKAIGKAHLKVNYTDSPAWMMVETLHDIQTPDCGNAICLSAALYANAVTAAIKDTLLYSGTANVIAQLKNLQHGDGSFSWWQGMPGSRYMTMAVAKTLARLNMLAGNSGAASGWKSSVDVMFSSAMRYMASEMAADVARMKKDKKEGYEPWLSNTQLDWLYTLTISGMDGGATADYLLKLVEKETKKADMATKAVAAVVLNKNGRKKDARTFVESIKEHTVYRSDMGRYFDSYRAAYSWCNYRIPTQTMCIEALNAVTPQDRQTITEMQRWLLSSKRTQDWGNAYNTVNAVHAFFGGDATRLAKGTPAMLKYNGAVLDTKVLNERSALIQGDVDLPVNEAKGNILVGKKTEGESWVSAYVTSRQKNSDVAQATMGISIKREVVSGANPKVGDKVKVRITIEADRDYDFVTVTDNRAACLEPVNQLSGYRYGCYQEIKDKLTAYHYNQLSKGTHVIETEYYIDRKGTYNSGSATAVCAYADEFRGTTGNYTIEIKK